MTTSISLRPPQQWTWRVAPPELAGALTSTHAAVAAVPPSPDAVSTTQALAQNPAVLHPLVVNAIAARSAIVVPAGAPAPSPSTAVHTATVAANIRSDVMQFHVQELGQRSTPQTVTSQKFKLSFDYCLVRASWEWLDGGFLSLQKRWYLPRTKAGEIASGTGVGGWPVRDTSRGGAFRSESAY